MIAWFARNHVAANLLMITILFLGLLSLSNKIPIEIFPAIDSEVVEVAVSLRGATPEDVEQGVAIRIEEAVQDLEGISKITSSSIEGSTQVSIEIDADYEPREMLNDIKSRIDAISTFPADAERAVIRLAQRKREVISVTVAGQLTEREIRQYAEKVRDELLRLPAVTQVVLDGVRNYEIAIEAAPDRLRKYGLTLADIGNAISTNSLDLSAGNIRTQGNDVLIRSKGQAYQRVEFEKIVVNSNADGSIIRLGDVATIRDEFEETPIRTRFNGVPGAMIDVFRVGNQSAIEIGKQVRDYIEAQQPNLPVGLALSYWDDDSQIVKKRLQTLMRNAAQGGILVIVLLALFLRPAIAFWVFIGIPISFMGAFILMPIFGVTINIMSLFGFILVLGIVVDDGIVTGENIYRHLRRSDNGLHAAVNGTQEVAIPVTFGVLTTVVAFTPLMLIEGHRGAIFAQIPAVVIPVLLFSLIETKFVLPAHLKYIKLRHEKGRFSRLEQWQQAFADGFESAVVKYYRPFLAVCLRHRYSTITIFIGVLAIMVSLFASGWSKFVFWPRVPSETARTYLTMPTGTSFTITDRYVARIADAARFLQDKYRDEQTGESVIVNIFASTGSAGGNAHKGRVSFEVVSPEERSNAIDIGELAREWRKKIGPIPGAESLTFRHEILRISDPIDIQLSAHNIATLEEVADKVKQHLASYPTVFEIADSLSDGKQEIQIELNALGQAQGLNRADLVRQVRQAFFGLEVQRIQRGRDDVRVMVRFPLEERTALANLAEVLITTDDGRKLPLAHVANLTPGKSPSAIQRIDRFRTVNVTADVDKEQTNMTVLAQELKVFLDQLLAQYPSVHYTLEGESREQSQAFGSLGLGILFVLFIVYSLLAIPFRSYVQPIIVMSIIPFGVIGAIIGHWIMAMPLTIMSLMGIMALIGIVVNDSLVLVDFINKQHRDKHMRVLRAVISAGIARFRPVILTSLTTFFGLLPLLFEKSTQAQFLIPMAVSLAFGIIFATVITLIMIPVNYLILEDCRRLLRSRKTNHTGLADTR